MLSMVIDVLAMLSPARPCARQAASARRSWSVGACRSAAARAVQQRLEGRLDLVLPREEDEHVAGQRLRDVDLQRRHHCSLDVVRLGRLVYMMPGMIAPPRDAEDGQLELGPEARDALE
eukprot:scaffold49269_cov51-Phaeocystis_antarctica.AAC.1